jgi:hypothetical protein
LVVRGIAGVHSGGHVEVLRTGSPKAESCVGDICGGDTCRGRDEEVGAVEMFGHDKVRAVNAPCTKKRDRRILNRNNRTKIQLCFLI